MEVSIRAPVRGATSRPKTSAAQSFRFYPRPRAGGDMAPASRSPDIRPFLSAPPCGGRLLNFKGIASYEFVSIRAPVRGATRRRRSDRAQHDVSIRAPVRGATALDDGDDDAERVSIRAPVRGATCRPSGATVPCRFLSAPPCGGRRLPGKSICSSISFLSAPPCGGRPGVTCPPIIGPV